MPVFENFFKESKGAAVSYQGKLLHISDRIPVHSGEHFRCSIEKTNSEWRQGFTAKLTHGIIQSENEESNCFHFWASEALQEFEFRIKLTSKKPAHLILYNFWEGSDGTVHVGHNGAAMVIEEIPHGRRYYCNDGHPDDNFDDIVFTVQKIDKV